MPAVVYTGLNCDQRSVLRQEICERAKRVYIHQPLDAHLIQMISNSIEIVTEQYCIVCAKFYGLHGPLHFTAGQRSHALCSSPGPIVRGSSACPTAGHKLLTQSELLWTRTDRLGPSSTELARWWSKHNPLISPAPRRVTPAHRRVMPSAPSHYCFPPPSFKSTHCVPATHSHCQTA